ncbi:TonB-dependent receptor plug domain-containing protein [Synoicihabitans lomoniglobus]|uniref:TonB-dependent receptor plug domain-containing protein n=1 Tax=Synoicihabitans lomoniglobus TaxID=2909285 RepID=A0AAF0CLT7_9BACT|nr:TonB-dependent receptor plug domain-containing protein [Opitutaceae bacterium LMO-M01]WED63228.1 TonB-dependent receptor plug domain-containing protein [Opitutaceae bacterium LMO-M01]
MEDSTTTDLDEETIVLSPFIIESANESDGYRANSTLAGTRVRTDLQDVASSISVITKEFLQDIGATDTQSLLQYTTNTEVGGLRGNFSGAGGGLQYNEDSNLLRPHQNTRVRGLDSADNTRDYFLTEIPWDSYNVDRVDMQRGPNSILFGVGSPAGIINTSVNTATYINKASIGNEIDSYGSLRFSGDFNYVLIPDQLAVRVSALSDETKYMQEQAFNKDERLFGAVRWEPELFGDDARTLIRANYETGRIRANRPRTLPPVDAITPWFLTGTDAYGNPGLNQFIYDQRQVNPGAAPFSDAQGDYPAAWTNNGAIGRQFWLDVVGYYGNTGDSSPTALRQPGGSVRNGIGTDGAIDGSIAGLPNARAVGIASYSSYALVSGMPGGSYYADRSLTDPTIFNFYDDLIDGDNKYEHSDWTAANFSFSQTFFNDRVGFEYSQDYQRYSDEQRVFIGNSDTYKIAIDMIAVFYDGTQNPNVGRPYVANSDEQANHYFESNRDSSRLTAYGELRASDFFDDESRLAKILGNHTITGLAGRDQQTTRRTDWATSAADPSYTQFTGENNSLTSHFRSYNYIAYLGPSLQGRSSASGANLSPVNYEVKAPTSGLVTVFDNNWARSTTPGDPNYVDPAAPYFYQQQNRNLIGGDNTLVESTQSENPANYGGWTTMNVPFLSADRGDKDALTYNAQRAEYILHSQAFTWQGHMFDDILVPTFGWRKDRIANTAGAAVPDALGIVNTDFDLNPETLHTDGETSSYGAVLKVPAKWTEGIGAKFAFHYFKGENFRAGAPRGDIFGNAIPNPLGKTKEYGFSVSSANDKLSLKVTKYETEVANATLSGSNPLGQNSYFLWAVPAWGTAFTANAAFGVAGQNDNNAWAWDYVAADDADGPEFRLPNGDINPAWSQHPSAQLLINGIEAWRGIPLDQNFFNAYGNEVALINVAGIQSGNWGVADPIWDQKFDNQPVSGGVLATFGTAPVFSVDTLSKGYEFELLAQPTRNWNVAVNASKTFATINTLSPTIAGFIDDFTQFLAGPAGDIRLWGGGEANAFRVQWQNNILNPYSTFKSQEGQNSPEIAPWRFNTVTNYKFDEGFLKGAWIGGSYRWEQGRILGYQYDAASGTLNIDAPFKGGSTGHLDVWVGYSRPLSEKVDWRIQLNMRNVGESKGLEPVSINPDGTTGFSRITEGMSWNLSNTFEF